MRLSFLGPWTLDLGPLTSNLKLQYSAILDFSLFHFKPYHCSYRMPSLLSCCAGIDMKALELFVVDDFQDM
jgi:hypothetical protein